MNPFTIPPEEDIFQSRDLSKKQSEKERLAARNLPIYKKTTMTSQMGRTRRIKESEIPTKEVPSSASRSSTSLMNAATTMINGDRRREKENMSDFVSKKREMFRVQMSLDTKREEIRKLEEKAQTKEQALKKSELMLEEDAIRFDAFLKENDRQAHEAIKRAEQETKLKQEKLQQIKRLNQEIQQIQSEMTKLQGQLEDCLKYKRFLDDLTPEEWIEEQIKLRQERQENRRQQVFQQRVNEWEEKKAHLEAEHEAKERVERERALKEGRRKLDRRSQPPVIPPAPKLEDVPLEQTDEELPMYFTEPSQLLDVFAQLEESNLFLIQNCQETELQLEELRNQFRETRSQMESKASALTTNIEELQIAIKHEEARADHLRQKATVSSGVGDQQDLLKQLNTRVKDVYHRCGFDADSTPTTLSMLTDIEEKLEELLSAIEDMPEDYVIKAEKEKEKERRERVRQERMAEQQRLYEERLKKSMERSQAPVKKRTGRQIMFRSAPLVKRKLKKEEHKKDDKDADLHFFLD